MLMDQVDHLMLLWNFCIDNWINTTPSLILLHLISPFPLDNLQVSSYKGMRRLLPALIADGTLKNLGHLHLCLPASIHVIFFDFFHECPHLQALTILHCPNLVNHQDILPLDVVLAVTIKN
jgi:hypothetical protein